MMISLVKVLPSRNASVRPAVRPVSGMPRAMRELPPLLNTAGELDLGDEAGWRSLGTAARRVVSDLIDAGELSWRLRIDPQDPPVVVARTLAVAWRQVTAASDRRHHRM